MRIGAESSRFCPPASPYVRKASRGCGNSHFKLTTTLRYTLCWQRADRYCSSAAARQSPPPLGSEEDGAVQELSHLAAASGSERGSPSSAVAPACSLMVARSAAYFGISD